MFRSDSSFLSAGEKISHRKRDKVSMWCIVVFWFFLFLFSFVALHNCNCFRVDVPYRYLIFQFRVVGSGCPQF